MNLAGLSLDKGPPLSVSLRFFITVPLMGFILALLILLSSPVELSSRWTPQVLALTHLTTLGMLAMAITGALMQILPVVAGVGVWRPVLSATVLHLSLSIGTLALVLSFWGRGWVCLFIPLLLLWGGGLVVAVGVALIRSTAARETVRSLYPAIAALTVTVGLGLWQAWSRSYGGYSLRLTDVHATWGLAGWTAMIVASVSYQVIPLFQVTPNYPVWFSRIYAWAVLLLLGVLLAVVMFTPGWVELPRIGLLIALVTYSIISLALLYQRKRHIRDVSLWFWVLSLSSLSLTGLLALFDIFHPSPDMVLISGTIFLFGFALSMIYGMLYKIVPFLIWLHLNNRVFELGAISVSVPHMRAIIPEKLARYHLFVHIGSLPGLIAIPASGSWGVLLSGVLLIVSSSILAMNLVRALHVYRVTLAMVVDTTIEPLRQGA